MANIIPAEKRVRKTHYYGDNKGGLRCGTVRPSHYTPTPHTKVTNSPTEVTCKACLFLMKEDGVV